MKLETRYPVNDHIVRIWRYDDGDISWQQESIEMVLNLAIFMVAVTATIVIQPQFGSMLMVVGMIVIGFSPKFRFKFFARKPKSETITYEGANVPRELIERYERAEEEFTAVMKELNALPLDGSARELGDYE